MAISSIPQGFTNPVYPTFADNQSRQFLHDWLTRWEQSPTARIFEHHHPDKVENLFIISPSKPSESLSFYKFHDGMLQWGFGTSTPNDLGMLFSLDPPYKVFWMEVGK